MYAWFVTVTSISAQPSKGIFKTLDGGATWTQLSTAGIDNCGETGCSVSGGFAASVTLSCSGLPAGTSCGTVAPFVPSAAGTAKIISVATTTAAAPGTYSFQINATGGGRTHSVTVQLVLN